MVFGIIGILVGMLLPAINKARAASQSVRCKANLRTLGQMIIIYECNNRGWVFPVGAPLVPAGRPTTLGTNVPPHERWPMKIFKFSYPWPPAYDPATYGPVSRDMLYQRMLDFPAEPYTPPVLLCPRDEEPYEAHSYVLNQHLSDNSIKASRHEFGRLTATEVVVAGEKVTTEHDYYMEMRANSNDTESEFDRVVEKYRHGIRLGSNYLYFDSHVDTILPNRAKTGIDPWDLRLTSHGG